MDILHFYNLTIFTPFIGSLTDQLADAGVSLAQTSSQGTMGTGLEITDAKLFGWFESLINNSVTNYKIANVERSLRNCSFLTLFLSMIFYWIQTAFSSPLTLSNLNNQKTAQNTPSDNGVTQFSPSIPMISRSSLSLPAQATNNRANNKGPEQSGQAIIVGWRNLTFSINSLLAPYYANLLSTAGLFWPRTTSPYKEVQTNLYKVNFGTITMILSNFLLMSLLICRWTESGHFPLSNLYESLMFLSWSCTIIHLILELKTDKLRPDARLLSLLIGSITSPIALFTNAFATFNLPAEMQKVSPLVPALQSNWLMMHVTVMIISYSALILGSLLSIAFLVLSNSLNFSTSAKHSCASDSGVLATLPSSEKSTSEENNSFKTAKITLAWNFDNLSYRVLGIGFPFLTIGILSGAVWANEAWGSYWSWDPKETWALLTWLIFAIYLHARITKGWQGKKPAIIASFGFVAIWICFLGVNLIGEGLHSYGWFSH